MPKLRNGYLTVQRHPAPRSGLLDLQRVMWKSSATPRVSILALISRLSSARYRSNWYSFIPAEALPPLLKHGKLVLEVSIQKDGTVAGLRSAEASGDVAMDRVAYGSITASSPFPPLPSDFRGENLSLRFAFHYNPDQDQAPGWAGESEAVKLSEILVYIRSRTSSSDATPEIAAAPAKADGWLKQIHGDAKFEDLARANSDGLTAAQGGDIGYFPRGMLAKSIEDLVFAMNAGEVSGVIQTKQGFVILKLTEHVGKKSTALTTPN